MELLLLEDDLVDQMAFKRWMAKELSACQLSIAGSIKEGKTLIEQNNFDLFICDFLLPDGDISDFLNLVNPGKVVCISGVSDPNQQQRVKELGIAQFFFKDPQLKYLEKLKNHVIDAHHENQDKPTKHSPPTCSSGAALQLETLKRTFDHNPEPIIDIIQIFLKQTPHQLAALKKAVEEKDAKTSHAISHRLKSSFRMMGLSRSVEKLQEIEEHYSVAEKKLPYFINIVEEVQTDAKAAYQHLHQELKTL